MHDWRRRFGAFAPAVMLLAGSASGCSSNQALSAGQAPGEIIGSVEIAADIPASNCRVFLEGMPIGARCDENGSFDLRRVPAGRWDLRIVVDDGANSLPARRVAAAANPAQVSDLGAVRLAPPGSIGGVVKPLGMDLSLAIVAIPEIGAVTTPNTNGGYLLTGVSPGAHRVVLLTDAGTVLHADTRVQPSKVTVGVDLDLGTLAGHAVNVVGRALRNGAADGGHGGIHVELVESLDGGIVAHTSSAADGAFSLSGKAGTYIVRAVDGDNPAHPIIPSVVLDGRGDLLLSSSLTVPAQGGDLNGNGIPDDKDPDIDGDGVLNADDAFPYDPAEWLDSDKDGVGDRADLRSKGGKGIDTRNPTPDTDKDGVLDFADNCVQVFNPDQKDSDGDGWGDLCDNCPFVYNPDQKDSVGNGIGDACRACMHNEDCGAGKLCQYGTCVACIDNAQCGDRVCDKASGSCVPCSAAAVCSAPARCDLAIGRCAECLQSSDCAQNRACINDRCLPQCLDNSSCPGGFCVGGGCVACRGNGDCPQLGQWCDGGTCRAQCVQNSDCDGGRSCDPMTHTCYAPCNGMCTRGQVCSGGKCLAACDNSVPCAQGKKCQAGVCVPECAVDGDCAGVRPFTICSGGQCVPSGKCAFDADCPVSNLCAAGTCAPRPTVLLPGKGYACAGPCDCRQGELCSAGACVVDPAPTHFVASGGTGLGPDPTRPGDLAAVLAALQPGDQIAIAAGASFGPAAFVISKPKVTLAGGYKVCAANRWVRDPSQSSTLHGATGAVLAIPGNNLQALDGVTVANVKLVMDDYKAAGFALQASFAPGLTLSKLVATLAAPQPMQDVAQTSVAYFCDHCAGVSFTDLSLVGLNASDATVIKTVDLPSGSGTLTRVAAGAVHAGKYLGISATNTIGALTITGASLEGFEGGFGGFGIGVTNGQGGTVTISDSTIAFGTYQVVLNNHYDSNSSWIPIAVSGCHDLALTGNTVDGRGLDESGRGHPWYSHFGITVIDSDGTVAMNTVYPSTSPSATYVYGYYLAGPAGNLAFTGNTLSGGSNTAYDTWGLLADSISKGTLAIKSARIGAIAGNYRGFGIQLSKVSSFSIVDSVVHSPSGLTGYEVHALDLVQSIGRVERSQLLADVNSGGNSAGIVIDPSSQLELYDSFVHGGNSKPGACYAMFQNGGQLTAVHNTLDAGCQSGSPVSVGVACQSAPLGTYTSNLISAGWSTSGRRVLIDYSGQKCSQLTLKNNYLWYPGVGGLYGDDLSASFARNGNKPDGNGNINGGNLGCYDNAFVPPDYHITGNSPCVDRGAPNPQRVDGSAITVDIDGNPRTRGAAPDIGCMEKM